MIAGKQLISHFLAVGPFLKEVFGKDLTVWISDTEKIVGDFPGESIVIKMTDVNLGKDDPMLFAMNKRKSVHTNVPKEFLGIPFKEVDSPIYDEHYNVIGCISIGVSLDQELKVASVSDSINNTVELIADSMKEIAFSAEEIRKSEQELSNKIYEISQLTKKLPRSYHLPRRLLLRPICLV
ncbi:MAG: hypothetical protein WCF96_05880 [Eubacteriales bacterium]